MQRLGQPTTGLRIALLVAGVVGLVACLLGWIQVRAERDIDAEDLHRRAHVLAHKASPTVRAALTLKDEEVRAALGTDLEGYRRLMGFAVFRSDGRLLAAGKGVEEFASDVEPAVRRAVQSQTEVVESLRSHDSNVHILVYPMRGTDGTMQGALAVLHDTSHLDDRGMQRLLRYALWILSVTLLVMMLVVGATWAAYERPLQNLANWMRRLRVGEAAEAPPVRLPVALLASESDRLAASFRAARATGWEESRELLRERGQWTRERLRAHALTCLRGGQLVVVSNREPYMHQLRDGKPSLIVPAGGLVSALDPILRACGGLWVAHGAGDADREQSDAQGRVMVPPDDPRYLLRRVWLSKAEEQGYYYGFANEGLWPLCHLAHERPTFRAEDWGHYERVNQRFADAVLAEIGEGAACVLVQDYQLALVPALLKAKRPDLRVGLFWHVPWPNPEAFRICPWRTQLLEGMLGADLVGFHLQQYCNNFLDTVDRMVEARLDWDHFTAELKGHTVLVRPYPISIEKWSDRNVPTGADLDEQMARLREQYQLDDAKIIVGVERIDYTKGLAERIRAIGRFLEKYPQYHGRQTFVILGAPSRTHIRRYRDMIAELETMSDEINWKYKTDIWKPLHFLVGHHNAATVHAFLRMSDSCIVSSLHDGMNLVAKEYVAARPPGDGVLILSEFAGAAREMSEALIINPYDTEQFADSIRYALEMDKEERGQRMERLQQVVERNNVHRWAAKFIGDLATGPSRKLRGSTVLDPASVAVP